MANENMVPSDLLMMQHLKNIVHRNAEGYLNLHDGNSNLQASNQDVRSTTPFMNPPGAPPTSSSPPADSAEKSKKEKKREKEEERERDRRTTAKRGFHLPLPNVTHESRQLAAPAMLSAPTTMEGKSEKKEKKKDLQKEKEKKKDPGRYRQKLRTMITTLGRHKSPSVHNEHEVGDSQDHDSNGRSELTPEPIPTGNGRSVTPPLGSSRNKLFDVLKGHLIRQQSQMGNSGGAMNLTLGASKSNLSDSTFLSANSDPLHMNRDRDDDLYDFEDSEEVTDDSHIYDLPVSGSQRSLPATPKTKGAGDSRYEMDHEGSEMSLKGSTRKRKNSKYQQVPMSPGSPMESSPLLVESPKRSAESKPASTLNPDRSTVSTSSVPGKASSSVSSEEQRTKGTPYPPRRSIPDQEVESDNEEVLAMEEEKGDRVEPMDDASDNTSSPSLSSRSRTDLTPDEKALIERASRAFRRAGGHQRIASYGGNQSRALMIDTNNVEAPSYQRLIHTPAAVSDKRPLQRMAVAGLEQNIDRSQLTADLIQTLQSDLSMIRGQLDSQTNLIQRLENRVKDLELQNKHLHRQNTKSLELLDSSLRRVGETSSLMMEKIRKIDSKMSSYSGGGGSSKMDFMWLLLAWFINGVTTVFIIFSTAWFLMKKGCFRIKLAMANTCRLCTCRRRALHSSSGSPSVHAGTALGSGGGGGGSFLGSQPAAFAYTGGPTSAYSYSPSGRQARNQSPLPAVSSSMSVSSASISSSSSSASAFTMRPSLSPHGHEYGYMSGPPAGDNMSRSPAPIYTPNYVTDSAQEEERFGSRFRSASMNVNSNARGNAGTKESHLFDPYIKDPNRRESSMQSNIRKMLATASQSPETVLSRSRASSVDEPKNSSGR